MLTEGLGVTSVLQDSECHFDGPFVVKKNHFSYSVDGF